MTKMEATALWRILTVLAGWDEIIDIAEIDDDIFLLVERLPEQLRADLNDDDIDQARITLDALIHGNLAWHDHPPGRHITNVPDPAGLLS